MLPDGTVFIFGGVGRDGKIVEQTELYDPETQAFEILPATGLTPRARHTATLLTEGLVLIAGGLSADGKALNDAELWDFQDGSAHRVPGKLNEARYDHTAALLADGTVLLSGGLDKNRRPVQSAEIFDPSAERFTSISSSQIENLKFKNEHVELAASLPLNGATDVPVDSLIAVRFSTPMRVETVNTDTVILSGPDGSVTIKVIPAEAGMLGFITPETDLLPGTTYTVILNGPMASDGQLLPVSNFSFTTEQSAVSGQPSGQTSSASSSSQSSIQNPKSETQIGESDDLVWRGEWKDGKPHSKWQDLPPLQAEAGVTALSGQVLDLKGEPLAYVKLEIGYGSYEIAARTDDTGRFLLKNIEPGWRELVIDGRRAHNPKSGVEDPKWGYGIFEYGSQIVEGETNILPFTIWLPKIDVANTAKIPSPTVSEVVVTTPKISGLEVHIPPNAVIYDYDGKVTDEINITPIPQDRTPFPLPKGVVTPALFTIQPGAGYVSGSQGVRLVYPNYATNPLLPGTRFNFWHYDPDYEGWYVYGLGTVTENGKQIIPDPGISIYEFTGAMVAPPSLKPAEGKKCRDSNNCDKGEPVDLQTGIFQTEKTDLFLPDVIPIKFTRTYRTRDTASRAFGIGASHSYDYFLVGDTSPYTFQEVVFPDGGTIHYNRIDGGAGNDFTVAVYEHTAAPGRFYKSQISWNGNGWNLKLKDGTLYVFRDSLGATRPGQAGIIRIQDRNNNAIDITRDGNGNVTKITSSPSGRWIGLTNDTTNNRVTQAKDNQGRTVTYTYDGTGRLSTVTDPNGGITQYTYDSSQRMLTITDPRQILFLTNEYDPTTGRITKQTQADTTTYLFAYTLNGSNVIQTDVTDPRGNVSRVTFNADGQILTNTEALGTPEEQLTTYERQAGTNLLLSMTDALNRKTAYAYDTMGNLLSITRLADTPDAVGTSFTYDPIFNQPATITDPLNHTTTFAFDPKGNVTSITNPLNQTTTITPNSAGQPISIKDPLNNITQVTYNSGDLATVTDPLGNVTTRFTDAMGRLLSVTNPLGRLTSYDYDVLNRLTKVTDPLAGLTQFGYDPNGNLLSVTDAKNQATSYTYNNMDRLGTRTDPLLHVETYNVYDGNGNLTQVTDRKSQVTNYTYDALNRRTGVTYVDTSTTSYTYDAGNRLTQVVDSISGIISRTYDSLDRLTSETTPQGSVTYTYDAAGRRATMIASGQPTTNYTYDNANRLTQITQGSSIVTFGYDDAGRRTSLTLPNGILVQYGYDTASRVTSITYNLGATVLGDLSYEYDKAGSRTKVGGTWARTGLPQAVSTTSYNAGNQQLTFGDKTLTYDNNGNLTDITDASGTTLYSWNARNQLTGIGGPSVSASFVYDGSGRREQKTVTGSLTEFLFDGVNPVQETSGTAVLSNIVSGFGVDEFLTRTDVPAETTSAFLKDALGSAIALADSAGAVQTEYTYEPFGKTTATGTSNSNPFQYTARENDGTGLYYYRARYYHPQLQRFISEDPILAPINLLANCTGQWDNRTVWAVPGIVNGSLPLSDPTKITSPYLYVANNPLGFRDPTGLDKEKERCRQNAGSNLFWCTVIVTGAVGLVEDIGIIGCALSGPGFLACATGVILILETPHLAGIAACYANYLNDLGRCG